jgi:hypothetical protein
MVDKASVLDLSGCAGRMEINVSLQPEYCKKASKPLEEKALG